MWLCHMCLGFCLWWHLKATHPTLTPSPPYAPQNPLNKLNANVDSEAWVIQLNNKKASILEAEYLLQPDGHIHG